MYSRTILHRSINLLSSSCKFRFQRWICCDETDGTPVNCFSLADKLMWRSLYCSVVSGPWGRERARNVQFPLRTPEPWSLAQGGSYSIQPALQNTAINPTCSQPETFSRFLCVPNTLHLSLILSFFFIFSLMQRVTVCNTSEVFYRLTTWSC